MSFNDLSLIEPLIKAVKQQGYTNPTPIQQQSIPVILQQRDILGSAQTGTGKTAAFAIPLLQLMHGRQQEKPGQRRVIKTLVLTPTRELAIQVEESFRAYGRFLDLRHLVIFGGVPQTAQVQALRRGVDILIATPGRLSDLLQQGLLSLSDIEFFVLDEADRMLDMGFIHDIRKVIARLPVNRQTLFFSATMPPDIQQLANSLLRKPVRVEITPVSSAAETVTQSVYHVEKQQKKSLLVHLLADTSIKTVLVFSRTKHGADRLAKDLAKAGIAADAIHGNKSQNARQRALHYFKTGKLRVLVATDIAARGIDIDELEHVINYDLPNVPETYVHRIGRTGRAGAKGMALSFCDMEERAYLKDIQQLVRTTLPVVSHPFATQVTTATVARPSARPSSHRRPGSNRPHYRSRNTTARQQTW